MQSNMGASKGLSLNPSGGKAFLYLIIGAIVAGIASSLSAKMSGTQSINGLIPLSALMMALVFLFSGLAVFLATKIVKTPVRSYKKALAFSAIAFTVTAILSLIFGAMKLNAVIVWIVNIIVTIWILKWYYQISIGKSIGVFVLDMIFSVVFGVILFFILTAIGAGLLFSTVLGVSNNAGMMNNQMEYDNTMMIDGMGSDGSMMDYDGMDTDEPVDSMQ